MKIYIFLLTFILVMFSCEGNKRQEPVDYTDDNTSTLSIENILTDTSKVLMAESPVYFDSTRIIIHPIGFVSLDEPKRSRFSKSSYDGYEAPMANNSKDFIRGNITYLLFEDVDNGVTHPLTKEVLNISSVEYMRDLARKKDKHYLLYILQDKDTNKDGVIDSRDITSLYISNLDGTGFLKISKNFFQYRGGEWVSWCSRYYFQTIEDADRNGEFDKRDTYHYYYIDFSSDSYKVVEYNPLKAVL